MYIWFRVAGRGVELSGLCIDRAAGTKWEVEGLGGGPHPLPEGLDLPSTYKKRSRALEEILPNPKEGDRTALYKQQLTENTGGVAAMADRKLLSSWRAIRWL